MLTITMVRAAFARLDRCLLQVFFSALLVLWAPITWAGPGGDGHTHGEETAPIAAAASPRVAMPGDIYDVVAIYKNGLITIYVDRLSSNEPVTEATLDVILGAETLQPKATSEGTYVLDAPAIAEGGAHELTISISGPDGSDLVAGTLTLPRADPHAQVPHAHAPEWLVDLRNHLGSRAGTTSVPPLFLAGGGLAGGLVIGTLLARRRRVAAAAALLLLVAASSAMAGPGGPGHTHGEEAVSATSDGPQRLPDGSVFLPKPTQRLLEIRTQRSERGEVARAVTLQGQIIADPNRSGVVQSINGGRVSIANGRLPAIGQHVKKGELLALVEPPVNAADETSIANVVSEIDQQIALAEVRLKRLEPLVKINAAPRMQAIDLKTELESLRARRAQLKVQRGQIEELRAPVDGEIAAVRAVAGQVVAPQDQIFQVIDPEAMWVEALAFGEFDRSGIVTAVATASDDRSLQLRFQGSGRLLQLQAQPIQFAIDNPPDNLMVGQPVRVLMQTAERIEGIVLPRASVVRSSNGEMIVWEHVASERFAPRPVRSVPINGDSFVVLAGLEADRRIVVSGAELINQVR